MRKFKEIIVFIIIMYLSSLIVKIIMNRFIFDDQYLIDSIFNAAGVTLGWYGYDYIHNKRLENKEKK